MKKIIIIFISLLLLCGCEKPNVPEEKPKEEVIEEVVEEEVVEETYLVELDDTQMKLLTDMYITETLANYEADGNTYTIKLEDKEKILAELDKEFNEDLLEILDGLDYLDDLYHSKDYQLYRVYFYDLNDCDAFTLNYLKLCFELGKIYNKFSERNVDIFAMYYKNGTDKEVASYNSWDIGIK